jgi:thymidylate synthase (FAD)
MPLPSTVSLVSVTPKAEELIAYCARVSNPDNQDNPDSEKLIRYLIKYNHWSPFELAHVVLEINTTRSIAAQILRHRSFSFQEFSQRYADVSLMSFATAPALRRQDSKNRQNSIDDLDEELITDYQTKTQVLFDQSRLLYEELLSAGVAKECAREVLPLATPTRLYMAGSVRSWLHYVELRSANGTQLEHRQIALQAKQILSEILPNVSQAIWGRLEPDPSQLYIHSGNNDG